MMCICILSNSLDMVNLTNITTTIAETATFRAEEQLKCNKQLIPVIVLAVLLLETTCLIVTCLLSLEEK